MPNEKHRKVCLCSDNYLQTELEASFIYEDDQIKATRDKERYGKVYRQWTG